MQRFSILVIPGLLASLVFLAVEYFDQAVESPQSPEATVEIAYNGYSEGINSVHFDEQGNIRYTMRADRQVSYPDAETTLEEPHIQLHQENDIHWDITARSGIVSSARENPADIEDIILNGDVEVYQIDRLGNRTVLATDVLTIDPTLDILTTDTVVTMSGDTFEQSAIGMRVDLNNEEYVFHREVKGRYAAP